MTRINKKAETALQKVEDIALRNIQAAGREATIFETGQLLGAIRATQNLGRHISAQSFRALILFRDEKGHEALGFERFDDFLNNHPDAPMTKHQFYERLSALEREGDAAFDLLNSLKIPASLRKQIGDGQIKIQGEMVIVGVEDKEVEIPINDRARVTEVLRELASTSATQRRTIERGQKEVTSLKKKLDTAKQSGTSGISPFNQAAATLLGAFTALTAEAEKLPEDQREEKLNSILPLIATQRMRLEEAFGFKRSNGHHLPITDATLDTISDAL